MNHKTPLDEVLETESEAIIENWAQALHGLSGTHYPNRPIEELRRNCTACLRAYRVLIQEQNQAPLREFVTEMSRERTWLGFTLVEVQRAFLAVRAVVRPRLVARYARHPDVAAFSDDWQRFEHAIEVALLRFSEDYHNRAVSHLERQVARANRLSSQLVELAIHDELTGLYNYRFFENRLHEEVQRSLRYRRPLTLLMADIDRFKTVNDRYGHPVGNDLLRHVAATFRRLVRTTDIPARYGGEEFAILLPETPLAGALVAAAHMRAAVAAGSPDLPAITISIGVSVHRATDPDGTRLVEEADQALYQAKQEGRNRVVLYQDPAPEG